MKKRILPICLVLTLLFALFSACGNSDTSSSSSTEASEASTASESAEEPEEAEISEASADNSAEEAPVEVPAEESAEETPEEEPPAEETAKTNIAYPVVEETATFTISYTIFPGLNMQLPNGFEDSPFWDVFEEITGVNFEIQEIELMTSTEKYQLMIVSDSLPDLVGGLINIYTNGAAQALDEEVVVDLMPYLDDYAPDYKAAIEQFSDGMAIVTTDDGRMGAFYEIYSTNNAYSDGYFIRDDMLEATGLGYPETLDDLIEVCKAMHANGVEYPLYLNSDGDDSGLLIGLWYNEWGYMDWYWDVETQHVEYSHVQDYNYDYILWLRDAYQAGTFLSTSASNAMGLTKSFNDLFQTDSVAIFTSKVSTIDEELQSITAETTVTPLACFTGENTEQGELSSITGDDIFSVSASCEDPETLIMAVNYLYTEEGSFLNNYGIEGLGYELDANGEPRFTDLVLDNPTVAERFAQQYYTNPQLPGLTDPYAISYTWSEAAQEAAEVWASAYTGNSATFDASLLTLTQEEQDVINLYSSDLDTRCVETLYAFVYGDVEPTKEAYQAFVDDVYTSLHLQEILDIYTNAWLRYLTRLE